MFFLFIYLSLVYGNNARYCNYFIKLNKKYKT